MSTRANIRVFGNNGDPIVCIYKHSDGYPEGLGEEIKMFASSGVLVNGLSGKQGEFNGIEDFTAGLIAFLKTNRFCPGITPGNTYIYPHDHVPFSSCEEYLYDIKEKNGRLWMEVIETMKHGYNVIASGYINEIVFEEKSL